MTAPTKTSVPAPLRPVHLLGLGALGFLRFIGWLTLLLWDTAAAIPGALFSRRGRALGWANLWAQMDRVGVRSISIVCLVLFCIGAILALQMAPILRQFGLVSTVADIISVAVGRELGPLVSAIVLSGFAGASIAAELGTMVVGEEIEALEASAASPAGWSSPASSSASIPPNTSITPSTSSS
jgi:phospholipid/cholesterol/gamma-HCH transport system permease protein